ncbi:MAG: uracil-DNA glycosylase [Pseudomonadota bacterium]
MQNVLMTTTATKQFILQQMGIDLWQQRRYVEQKSVETHQAPQQSMQESLQLLQQKVSKCTLCALHQSRTQTVFGVGNPNADLMIIGEAPGMNEDKQGKPFVGRAGQLLTQMLYAIGLQRESIFIANVLKCRPPRNRDPQADEVATCTPYLNQQIELIKPKLMVAVGRIAAHYLLQSTLSLSRLRKQVHQYGSQKTPLIVTYHPAYLLRSPVEKRRAYGDLLFIKQHLDSLS